MIDPVLYSPSVELKYSLCTLSKDGEKKKGHMNINQKLLWKGEKKHVLDINYKINEVNEPDYS